MGSQCTGSGPKIWLMVPKCATIDSSNTGPMMSSSKYPDSYENRWVAAAVLKVFCLGCSTATGHSHTLNIDFSYNSHLPAIVFVFCSRLRTDQLIFQQAFYTYLWKLAVLQKKGWAFISVPFWNKVLIGGLTLFNSNIKMFLLWAKFTMQLFQGDFKSYGAILKSCQWLIRILSVIKVRALICPFPDWINWFC